MHALAPTMPADLRALFDSLGVTAHGERPRSERVLERLLDLNRSVALSGVLDQPLRAEALDADQRLGLHEAQLARLRLLDSKLVAGLRDLREQVDRRFAHMTLQQAHGTPDAAALYAQLAEGGGLQPGGDARRRSVAARASASYVAAVDRMLKRLLDELARLRRDVQVTLQQGNADTRRLAALDRVLDGTFRVELELSRAKVQTAIGKVIDAQLREAFANLPPHAEAAALQPLFAPHGHIGRFLRDSRRVCHALLDLEWSALMGLVQASVQAEQSPSSVASSSLENSEP